VSLLILSAIQFSLVCGKLNLLPFFSLFALLSNSRQLYQGIKKTRTKKFKNNKNKKQKNKKQKTKNKNNKKQNIFIM